MSDVQHPPPEKIHLTGIMHALSDPVRMEIVRRLAQAGELSCGELQCDRPKSSMSHHFKILRESGLLESRPDGKVHRNTLRSAVLNKRFPGLLESLVGAIARDAKRRTPR